MTASATDRLWEGGSARDEKEIRRLAMGRSAGASGMRIYLKPGK
jgi:hypothetical protein